MTVIRNDSNYQEGSEPMKKAEDGRGEGFEEFLAECPGYEETSRIDNLRAIEYSRLDSQGHVYLDYTGGGLYSDLQIRQHMELLLGNVLGNPHSFNPTSSFTTDMVERCRRRVLKFFNAPTDEYVAIFTANATHALKLVGESYPFDKGDMFLLSFDNHNSVNGIREFDRACGAITRYIPVVPPDMRLYDKVLERNLSDVGDSKNRLFAFPAQSNFSGVHHPLDWIDRAHEHGWDVLLDAAAFVPTNRLDLSKYKADFVAVSFYKIFGYPTGVGALVARREALEKLHRPWFAGGTITVASVQADKYYLAEGAEGFEDGTLNYACLPAVETGIDFIESIGMDTIHDRVQCLTDYLLQKLLDLKHGNGRPIVRIYGPADTKGRGGTIALNIYTANGNVVDHRVVEDRAAKRHISLRTGCFCNPGAGELALGLSKDEMIRCLHNPGSRMSLEEFWQCIDGKSTGAVRLSLGIVSNYNDVQRALDFILEFRED
jgi:molybdenum cofactor sulfurtransferase